MDTLKIFIALIVAFAVILIIMKGRISLLFWLGVLLMFSRRVNFPFLGELEPSTIILYFTALLVIPKLFPIIIKNYFLQLLVLIIGLIVGAFFYRPTIDYWSWSLAILSIYVMCALSDIYIRDEEGLERLSAFFIVISFIIGFTTVIAYAGFADNVIILSEPTALNIGDGLVLYSKTYGIAYSNSVNGFIPLALIFLYSKKWNNPLRYFIFLSITASVFISLKRIGFLSLGFSLVYILFRNGKPKLKALLLYAAVALCGLFFFGKEILERFQDTQNALFGDESPDIKRTGRIEYAWKLFKEHPILGNGSGNITYIHNGFLEILVNLGLPGLVIIIPWLLKPAQTMLLSRERKQKDWAAACLIFLLTLFLFEAVLNRLDLFWIFGLLYAGLERAKSIYQRVGLAKNNQLWENRGLLLQ